jgi:hypothetical protein
MSNEASSIGQVPTPRPAGGGIYWRTKSVLHIYWAVYAKLVPFTIFAEFERVLLRRHGVVLRQRG